MKSPFDPRGLTWPDGESVLGSWALESRPRTTCEAGRVIELRQERRAMGAPVIWADMIKPSGNLAVRQFDALARVDGPNSTVEMINAAYHFDFSRSVQQSHFAPPLIARCQGASVRLVTLPTDADFPGLSGQCLIGQLDWLLQDAPRTRPSQWQAEGPVRRMLHYAPTAATVTVRLGDRHRPVTSVVLSGHDEQGWAVQTWADGWGGGILASPEALALLDELEADVAGRAHDR